MYYQHAQHTGWNPEARQTEGLNVYMQQGIGYLWVGLINVLDIQGDSDCVSFIGVP